MDTKRKPRLTTTQRNEAARRTTIRARASSKERLETQHTAELAKRAQTRQASSIQRQTRSSRHRNVQRAATNIATAPIKTSIGESVLFVIFIMAGLILFYNLVSRPTKTNNFLDRAGDWLAAVSTTQPLFTNTEGTT